MGCCLLLIFLLCPSRCLDSEVNTQVSTQTLSPEVTIPNFPSNLDRPKKPSPTKRPTLRILQPDVTYTGSPIQPLQKGLPKQTESLCPECNKVIRADIFADDGQVVMEKSCAEHGIFRDIIFRSEERRVGKECR